MKIYMMGRGHRLSRSGDALGLSRLVAQIIDKSTENVRFGTVEYPISAEDLIIVTRTSRRPRSGSSSTTC
jgi:hypothetical protein